MSQQKNRPTPRRTDARAAQRAEGTRLRTLLGIPSKADRHRERQETEFDHGPRGRLRARRGWSGIRINPGRDRRSFKSGRLRRELAVAAEAAKDHPDAEDLIAFTDDHLDLELLPWQRDWIRKYYARGGGRR